MDECETRFGRTAKEYAEFYGNSVRHIRGVPVSLDGEDADWLSDGIKAIMDERDELRAKLEQLAVLG